MKATIENKVSMYHKVREFFSNHLAALEATAPALGAQVAEYEAQLTRLDQLLTKAGESPQGYTAQKQTNRAAMSNLAMTVSGATYAYAKVNNDEPLAAKADLKRSYLDQMRDTDALYACERLLALTTPLAAAIAPFGASAQHLEDFALAIDTYKTTIQEPADQRGAIKSANQEAERQLPVVDAKLDVVDAIMQAISPSHSLLYNQYRADRLIDDNASGISDPDVTQIIGANTLRAILNEPYQASRKFRLVNNGTVEILWGLSSSDTEVTHPLVKLAPDASSTLLSSTLAPDGNFLLVKNETSLPTEVDLYIVEE